MSIDLHRLVERARASGDFDALIAAVPYARFIGMGCEQIGERFRFRMEPRESNIGNPIIRTVHGGVVGGFMELSAALQIVLNSDAETLPRVVDISVDYLRPTLPRLTFADCELIRQGRKLINVGVQAWQADPEKPVASARAHFLLTAS